MDTLHTVLRAIRGEAKPRRDHLTVFREFLGHLDRAAKRGAPAVKRGAPAKQARAQMKRTARKGKR